MNFCCPFLGNINCGKEQGFFKGVVGWENATTVVELAILAVQALNRVGSVQHLSDLGGILENWAYRTRKAKYQAREKKSAENYTVIESEP